MIRLTKEQQAKQAENMLKTAKELYLLTHPPEPLPLMFIVQAS